MKKAILLFTLLAVCVGMILPAYAAGSAFTPSVSYKGEPDLVGTEVTLPILGNDTLTVLPDIEITTENEFYDYGAKYTNGMCRHIIPSRLPESVRAEVAEIGERLYKILNCRGLSRIDFIVDEKKGPMVIEVNTLPGMTEMSLFPDSAAYVGISFAELAARILELGIINKRKKQLRK
jgi:D-alanine-D-alanine ligase